MVVVVVSEADKLEEWLTAARSEDMGDVAGRFAEEIDGLRQTNIQLEEALAVETEKRRALERAAHIEEDRLRRLRTALLASGVGAGLVHAIEWDSAP
jgi:hypothetical protein